MWISRFLQQNLWHRQKLDDAKALLITEQSIMERQTEGWSRVFLQPEASVQGYCVSLYNQPKNVIFWFSCKSLSFFGRRPRLFLSYISIKKQWTITICYYQPSSTIKWVVVAVLKLMLNIKNEIYRIQNISRFF